MRNIIVLILVLLMTSACATKRETNVITDFNVPIYKPGQPRAVLMRPVQWRVLENNRLALLLEDATKQNKDIVLFTLTAKDYENLSLDIQELKRYLLQQQEIIKYYEGQVTTSGK